MKKTLNIIFYRNFGIINGRGYQPYTIYKYSKKFISNFYLMRNFSKLKFKNLKFMPITLIYLMYGFSRFLTNFLSIFKIQISEFILVSQIYDFYLRNIISYKEDYYLFSYIPSKKFIKKLKEKNKKLIFYVGVSHPVHTQKITVEEFKKLNIEISKYLDLKYYEDYIENINEFDQIITTSSYCSKNWKKYGFKGKIHTCPLGVNLNEYNFKINKYEKEKKKIFLYAGRISCLKGVNYLLEAWEELNLEDSKLILIGDKKEVEWNYFKQKIENSKNVEYLGYNPNMTKFYKKSLVFVFPSLMEGFGKVVTEAMASGLPIIGTPCVQHSFKNKKEGIYIDYKDKEQIKKAIKYYYDNPKKAIKDGRKAKNSLKNKTWDDYGITFKKIIVEILNK